MLLGCTHVTGHRWRDRVGVSLGYASGRLRYSDCTATGLGLDFYWRRQSKSSPSTNRIDTLSAWRSEANSELTPRGNTVCTAQYCCGGVRAYPRCTHDVVVTNGVQLANKTNHRPKAKLNEKLGTATNVYRKRIKKRNRPNLFLRRFLRIVALFILPKLPRN